MTKNSIFYMVADSINENGELPSEFHLPQEDDKKLLFADGAMDGIYLYHMSHEPLPDEDAETLGSLLRIAAEGREAEAEDGFFAFCKNNRAISLIDAVPEYIANHQSQLSAADMYRFAVNMMVASDHIECVKIGMIILLLFDTEENEAVADAVRTIGLSDEFTLFSVLLMRNWNNGAMEILDLAKHVHSWGRIHCMDFIEPNNDEIKAWILENGVDNDVVPAYSGLAAYEKADVRGVLAREDITKQEMNGILKIVSAMLDEGPVSGISNLADPKEFLVSVVNKAKELISPDESGFKYILEIEDRLEEYAEDDDQ